MDHANASEGRLNIYQELPLADVLDKPGQDNSFEEEAH